MPQTLCKEAIQSTESISQWILLFTGDITKYWNDTTTDWSSYKQNTKVYISVTETSITEFSLPLWGSACSMSPSPAFVAVQTVKQQINWWSHTSAIGSSPANTWIQIRLEWMTPHSKWNVRARESDSQPRGYGIKKTLKTYFSPSGKSLVAQPFTKPGCLENHKRTSKTNIRRTLNSA